MNPGPGGVLLSGELKRAPHGHGARRLVVSLVFLRPGSSSWLSRAGSIEERYANSQGGFVGGWTLWFAALCAIGGAGIAFFWAVSRAGRPE
jgi:hypothetical protein